MGFWSSFLNVTEKVLGVTLGLAYVGCAIALVPTPLFFVGGGFLAAGIAVLNKTLEE